MSEKDTQEVINTMVTSGLNGGEDETGKERDRSEIFIECLLDCFDFEPVFLHLNNTFKREKTRKFCLENFTWAKRKEVPFRSKEKTAKVVPLCRGCTKKLTATAESVFIRKSLLGHC